MTAVLAERRVEVNINENHHGRHYDDDDDDDDDNNNSHHKQSFFRRHWIACTVVCVAGGLFLLKVIINACGDSTSSVCQTFKDIGNVLGNLASPFVKAWDTAVTFFAVFVGLIGLGFLIKPVSRLGSKIAKAWGEAKSLQDGVGVEKGRKVKAVSDPETGKPYLAEFDDKTKELKRFYEVEPTEDATRKLKTGQLESMQTDPKLIPKNYEAPKIGNRLNPIHIKRTGESLDEKAKRYSNEDKPVVRPMARVVGR